MILSFSETGNYGPFNIGSYWKYKQQDIFFDDQLMTEDTTYSQFEWQITKDTIVNNTQYFKIGNLYYHTQNGEYFISFVNALDSNKWITQKYLDINAAAGTEWKTDTIALGMHPVEGEATHYKEIRCLEKGLTLTIHNQVYENVIKHM